LLVIGYDAIEYASLTDVGIRRSNNQDAHATLLASDPEQWKERGHVFLVADGMGGHAVGELASGLAVSIIPHTYHKYAPQTGVPALRKAFVEANASIHAKGQQNPEFVGMGTTTTALLLRPEGAWIGHVGDSRAYRIRSGQIEQISFDHSWVWEMARRKGVEPELLQDIPSNMIARSLGPEPLVQVDLEGPYPLKPGDIFLLCSDGLSGQLSDAEMGAIASTLPPAEACQFLVDIANLRGGPDNITVLIVRLHDHEPQAEAASPSNWSWFRPLPWSLAALLLGVSLVAYAVVLTADEHRRLGVLVFIAAALIILAGIAGLIASYRQEKNSPAAEPAPPPPRIYRHSDCRIEQALLDKLTNTLPLLETYLKERNWDANSSDYHEHLDKGSRLIAQGQTSEGFCELCRAMHVVAEAVHRQRPKGDALPPLWDRQH
jgi:protein phosphatase